jgi:predicted dehydrogenase
MSGVAIVGQGYMGRTHAQAWSDLGMGESIRYIVAPGSRSWTDLAPEAQFTSSLEEALLDPEVDMVSVCTPTASHADIAIRSLHSGKHVLLEKPIALTLEDARRIKEAADASGSVLMIAQVVRFFAGYEALRQVRDERTIGAVLSVRAARSLATPQWAPWWPDENQSGGVPTDFSIHDFDQANVFLGTPIAVTAQRLAAESPLETSIEYAGGGLAQVLSFPYLPQGSAFSSSLELVGSEGSASYRMMSAAPTAPADASDNVSELTVSTVAGLTRTDIPDNQPYTREVEYFLSCVQAGTRPDLSSADSAIAALRVSIATRQSLATGKRVEL